MTMQELSGLRLLVVEDEGLVLMLIEEYLADLGCEVVDTASRLDEALIKAKSAAIDAAVVDVNLAGTLSYPVAQVLFERKVPFIFATGYGALALPNELKTVPVLSKPFQLEQLAQALCRATIRNHPHCVAAERGR